MDRVMLKRRSGHGASGDLKVGASRRKFCVCQIYYDNRSRALLDPGLIPLDNTVNSRPDWFEFNVIREFLNARSLDDAEWWGILSPHFGVKTRYPAELIYKYIEHFESVLVRPRWASFLRSCGARARCKFDGEPQSKCGVFEYRCGAAGV
jgi:hypothetical protein